MPTRKINRLYLVLLITSFVFGFFYNSAEHSDTFYSNLIRSHKIIEELKSGKCDDLNNQEFHKKLESSGLEFHYELTEKRVDCREFINAPSFLQDRSFPLTEILINEEFEKKFKYFTLKKNTITGLYFFAITLFLIIAINFIRKVITWIMNGS